MTLRQELKKATHTASLSRGPACGMAIALRQLRPARRKEYLEALRDEQIYGSVIRKKLAAETKLPLQQTTVTRHRRNECKCSILNPELAV